jgi:hypothetical protein
MRRQRRQVWLQSYSSQIFGALQQGGVRSPDLLLRCEGKERAAGDDDENKDLSRRQSRPLVSLLADKLCRRGYLEHDNAPERIYAGGY